MNEYTKEYVEKTFGKIVFETATIVVRAKEKANKVVWIVTHHIGPTGREQIPNGYIIGVNILYFGIDSKESKD